MRIQFTVLIVDGYNVHVCTTNEVVANGESSFSGSDEATSCYACPVTQDYWAARCFNFGERTDNCAGAKSKIGVWTDFRLCLTSLSTRFVSVN